MQEDVPSFTMNATERAEAMRTLGTLSDARVRKVSLKCFIQSSLLIDSANFAQSRAKLKQCHRTRGSYEKIGEKSEMSKRKMRRKRKKRKGRRKKKKIKEVPETLLIRLVTGELFKTSEKLCLMLGR